MSLQDTSPRRPPPRHSRLESGHSRVLFGSGCVSELGGELDRLGATAVLLITAGSIDLPDELPVVDRITRVRGDVSAALAQAARGRTIASSADAMVAVGGGAAIGLAKAVALTSGVPIAAVPTTYAGSEMTPVWALSQPGGRISGTDWRVLPRLVIYDPRLQLPLRARTSAMSGVTALAHAVEALWAPAANAVSNAVAEDALRALAGGLERVVEVPENLAIRTTMLRGAWLAGMAMAGAGAAIHHQLCDLLVSAFRLPYAEVHAAVLPHVAAIVAPEAPAAMVRIARALRVEDPVGELRRLVAALELPCGLRDLGLTEAHVPAATELALEAALASPRMLTQEEIRGLMRRVFDGGGRAP